jgi:hypothetical protein
MGASLADFGWGFFIWNLWIFEITPGKFHKFQILSRFPELGVDIQLRFHYDDLTG